MALFLFANGIYGDEHMNTVARSAKAAGYNDPVLPFWSHVCMFTRPRFIADAMLGSLATWLRILGFDTLYFRRIDDNELIRIAKQEDRILLTRDSGIAKSKKAGHVYFVKAEETFAQVRDVVAAFDLHDVINTDQSRCPRCNGETEPVTPEAVAGMAPDHVLRQARAFARCGGCGKVYWDGTHKRKIDSIAASFKKQEAGRDP
jgi:uncharacterized protein with PIN domain